MSVDVGRRYVVVVGVRTHAATKLCGAAALGNYEFVKQIIIIDIDIERATKVMYFSATFGL